MVYGRGKIRFKQKILFFFFRFQIMLIHWIFKFDFQSLKVELFHFDLIQIELDSIAKNNSLMHIACMFLFHTRIMHVNQENLLHFFLIQSFNTLSKAEVPVYHSNFQ